MASNNIGKWSAQATLDANGFTSGIQKMMGGIKGFVGSQGMGLIANLPATLGLASIEGIFSRLNDTLERELDLGFLADQLGAPLGMLQQLRAIASENSVGADQFTSAMERMNQVLGQARLGSAEAVETFGRLGITVEDLRNQDFQTIFLRASRGLDGMTDRAARARTAMELFGRRGAGSMLRFVRDIDGSLADMQNRGVGLNADEALEQINDLDNAIDRMSTRWDEFWRRFLARVSPAVTQLLEETEGIFSDPMNIAMQVNALNGVTDVEPAPAWVQAAVNAAISGVGGHQASGASSGGFGGTGFMLGIGTFGAVLEQATNAARDFANAQIAAARQNEAAMERLRGMVNESRTPLENFNARIREISNAGLDQTQQARLAMRAFNEVRQDIAETPGIGSLDAGSSEVAAIIANQNTPLQDVAATMRALMEQQRQADADARTILAEIRGFLAEQNQGLNQAPRL